jgi:hypothetical protein
VSARATVSDYHGNPLSAGDHVEAWRDGVRYLATVKEVRPPLASDAGARRIVIVRDDDDREVQTRSNAVVVIAGKER